ncbi:hypothetical protein V6N12_006227 [Hibiscus sabdariffa]|uniref:Uncharacterized protein n=1 Tax=Hibiscus sabdariffa TaxID=183260 RepID=A0ABR2EY75_9ROSI
MGKGEGTCAVEVVGANEVAGSFLIPGCRRGSLRQLSCCHREDMSSFTEELGALSVHRRRPSEGLSRTPNLFS